MLLWIDWRGERPIFQVLGVAGEQLVPVEAAHLDHVIPESRNGPTSLDNTVIACATCNLAKGDSAPGDPGFILWAVQRRRQGQPLGAL